MLLIYHHIKNIKVTKMQNSIDGHHDVKKIDPNHLTKYPLIGFQLTFH